MWEIVFRRLSRRSASGQARGGAVLSRREPHRDRGAVSWRAAFDELHETHRRVHYNTGERLAIHTGPGKYTLHTRALPPKSFV